MLHFVNHVTCIGLGGIGTWFLPPFLRLLQDRDFPGEITLVDGDTFSESNLSRQDASLSDIGRPKAEALANRMARALPGLRLRSLSDFVTGRNVAAVVRQDSLIVVAVDNHPARRVVALHAATLRDVCILSAGNEMYDGNVHITLRRAGRDLTTPLIERHPEIATAQAGDRSSMGCAELIAMGDTQLLLTNFLAAAALLAAFHALWEKDVRTGRGGRTRRPLPQEVYFDIREQAMSAVPVAQATRQDQPAIHAVA